MNPTVKHLIIYADSCGGQNRSIKTILILLILLVHCHNLETITVRYFVSGHSYNSCDRNFGKVEQKIKLRDGLIFDLNDLIQAIEESQAEPKTPIVKEMQQPNFLYLGDSALSNIVNRKYDLEGNKFSWLDIHEIILTKSEPNLISFKYGLDDEPRYFDIGKYESVMVDGKKEKRLIPIRSIPLIRGVVGDLKPINVDKRADLLKMRNDYIPNDKQAFWTFLDDCETSIESETIESLIQPKFLEEPSGPELI